MIEVGRIAALERRANGLGRAQLGLDDGELALGRGELRGEGALDVVEARRQLVGSLLHLVGARLGGARVRAVVPGAAQAVAQLGEAEPIGVMTFQRRDDASRDLEPPAVEGAQSREGALGRHGLRDVGLRRRAELGRPRADARARL